VKTTGIYCRPICPAKPKRENVEFFLSAHAAEKSGYRPCLRCRPESAPLSPAWIGKTSVVQRALKVISNQGFFDSSEDKFAAQFGVTARHLRRLFVDEVGLTPKQIAFNNRLNFARKLITETQMPMTTIAHTAGFASLRRFNDAMKKKFRRAPSELRKKMDKTNTEFIQLSLSYRPPFDWEHALGFYRSHIVRGVENVTEDSYERIFRHGKSLGFLRVTHDAESSQLKLQIATEDSSAFFNVSQRIRQMFDLDSDPLLVANSFRSNKFLDSLWKKYPGLRVTRGWDPFESAICTILGQLVSIPQARNLIQQLVENYGEKVVHPQTGETAFLFPTAKVLAKANLDKVLTTQARKKAISEFSKVVASGELDLLIPKDALEAKKQLLDISGIGEWSAEYISLRALGNTDAFPGTDLILKRAMEKHPDLNLDQIRPWRAYAAIYLWKHYHGELSKIKGQKK
jgi:AraC family transcriptional regulator of adaptative response / DNA-3-methyladenine glycosylase II